MAASTRILLKAKADVLSPRALELKRAIQKKVGKPAPVEEGELRRENGEARAERPGLSGKI